MSMVGDGREGQPTEGELSLDGLAESMLDEGDGEQEALEEGEEESDDPEVEEGEDDEQEEPTVTIKHDGKDVTLKQSEALALAQQGFDYSKKTMAVAEERKAVQAERDKADSYRKQHEESLAETNRRLAAYTQYMQAQVGSPPPVELAAQDAAHYLALKAQHEARTGQLQEAIAAQQAISQEQARMRQAWIGEKAAATETALRDTLPSFDDNTISTLAEYAGKAGLTPQNMDVAMLEPGFWILAHKAQAYDALQEQKAKLKPVNKLSKAIKPQAINQPPQLARRQEAMKRYDRNPSLSALADLL